MDAGAARRLDVGALLRGPVFVVADGEKYFVRFDQCAATVGIDAAEIADVVAVRLEPADHRVFGVIDARLPSRAEWPVVTDLVGRLRAALIQAIAAVLVVRMPRGVGGLKQQIRRARVIANDEHDVAGASGIRP